MFERRLAASQDAVLPPENRQARGVEETRIRESVNKIASLVESLDRESAALLNSFDQFVPKSEINNLLYRSDHAWQKLAYELIGVDGATRKRLLREIGIDLGLGSESDEHSDV